MESVLYLSHHDHRDTQGGFQLYHSEPSGNFSAWKVSPIYGKNITAKLITEINWLTFYEQATAIGASSQAAQAMLRNEYQEGFDLLAAKNLAIQVLGKTMDCVKLSEESVEMLYLSRNEIGNVLLESLTVANEHS